MTRQIIEAALRQAYARREANDAAGAHAVFAPDAVYRVAGHPDSCPMVAAHRGQGVLPALEAVCQAFRAVTMTPTAILVDGDRAMVRVSGTFVHTPTGERVVTELMHDWTFRDGKVVEVVEFLDTAYLASLLKR